MRLASAYLGLAAISLLAGCATADESVNEARLAIQEKTRPSFVLGCQCPSYNPEAGKLDMSGSGPYFRVEGDFGEYPLEFKNILNENEPFKKSVKAYSSRISNSSSEIEAGTNMHCWTGVCPVSEHFITDLKDTTKTWVFLSQRPKSYAHKCTYAKDPNAWTTQPCPMKGSN